MKRGLYLLLSVTAILVIFTSSQLFAAGSGFVPKWNVGDAWALEASYKDLKNPGDVWLPPIKWFFKVRAIKEAFRQECYVLHIYPQSKRLKVQAVLWLAVNDLRPLKVIDIFPSGNSVKSVERSVDPYNPNPLISEDSIVPYDLPVFPLIKNDVQNADGFDAYRSEASTKKYAKVTKIGGLSFKKTYGQKNKAPDKQHADAFAAYKRGGQTFQVEIAKDKRGGKGIVQLWQQGSPWAISSESNDRKVKLVPLTSRSNAPESNGGDE